jgi:large subunit ribosomal protein L10e
LPAKKVKKMKASTFKHKDNMPYTQKKYMGGIPGSKIVKFTMGNTTRDFNRRVELINIKDIQIRHNALESARIAANRYMEKMVGKENFMLKIIPFPHNIVREHKRVNVAQADRFQEGMKKAYGKPTAMVARIEKNNPIIIVELNENNVENGKEALRRAAAKLPVKCRIFEHSLN